MMPTFATAGNNTTRRHAMQFVRRWLVLISMVVVVLDHTTTSILAFQPQVLSSIGKKISSQRPIHIATSLESPLSSGLAVLRSTTEGVTDATITVDGTHEEVIMNVDVSSIATASLAMKPPFKNIMACNRAEIAVRIMRAATELNCGTVAIYGYEDRFSQHRWGADRSGNQHGDTGQSTDLVDRSLGNLVSAPSDSRRTDCA